MCSGAAFSPDRGTEHGRPADVIDVCVFVSSACVCICVFVWEHMCVNAQSLIFVPSSIHVRQLFEAGAPVVEVVIVLVSCAGGVEGADGAGGGAASLVVEHQQGVVGRGRGVVVRCSQTLRQHRDKGTQPSVSTRI